MNFFMHLCVLYHPTKTSLWFRSTFSLNIVHWEWCNILQQKMCLKCIQKDLNDGFHHCQNDHYVCMNFVGTHSNVRHYCCKYGLMIFRWESAFAFIFANQRKMWMKKIDTMLTFVCRYLDYVFNHAPIHLFIINVFLPIVLQNWIFSEKDPFNSK